MVALMLLCCVRRLSSSVCHLSATLCTVAKWCVLEQQKYTIDSRTYEKSIGTKMNDRHLCLEVIYGHVNLCVTFAIDYLGK